MGDCAAVDEIVHPHMVFVFCAARDPKMEDWFAVFQLICKCCKTRKMQICQRPQGNIQICDH